MKIKSFLQLFLLICASANLSAQKHQLVKLWQTDTLLKVPESVLFDAGENVLYVTNIDGQPWDKDGNGSVGKVGVDGKIITTDWITGLHAPKGMGLVKNNLYVADVDEVLVIDVKKGAIVKPISIEGAQGLNDVTIGNQGDVFVSDSKARKVHRLINDVPMLYLDNLKGPNGLLFHNNNLYVLDNGGLYKADNDKNLTKITDGMEGGTDGIENVQGNEFIVSCWSGSLWHINEDGTKEQMLDTREEKINTADIGYDKQKRIVYVPTFWKNSIIAYELK